MHRGGRQCLAYRRAGSSAGQPQPFRRRCRARPDRLSGARTLSDAPVADDPPIRTGGGIGLSQRLPVRGYRPLLAAAGAGAAAQSARCARRIPAGGGNAAQRAHLRAQCATRRFVLPPAAGRVARHRLPTRCARRLPARRDAGGDRRGRRRAAHPGGADLCGSGHRAQDAVVRHHAPAAAERGGPSHHRTIAHLLESRWPELDAAGRNRARWYWWSSVARLLRRGEWRQALVLAGSTRRLAELLGYWAHGAAGRPLQRKPRP